MLNDAITYHPIHPELLPKTKLRSSHTKKLVRSDIYIRVTRWYFRSNISFTRNFSNDYRHYLLDNRTISLLSVFSAISLLRYIDSSIHIIIYPPWCSYKIQTWRFIIIKSWIFLYLSAFFLIFFRSKRQTITRHEVPISPRLCLSRINYNPPKW